MRHLIPSVTLVLALASSGAGRASSGPEIRLDARDDSLHLGTFVAENLDPEFLAELESRALSAEEWQEVFAVYTGSVPGDRPAVAGSYAIFDGRIVFRPRFPLVDGLTYSARLDVEPPLVATFSLPKEETEPTTVVTEVYPTADELPENLLRVYVHFSAPMTRGEAYERVKLIEEPGGKVIGKVIDRPFVEIAEELWDPDVRRLTLLFDPGRIKRGLRPHDEVGPPLRAGISYRLVVDAGWSDAEGLPLKAPFEKRFSTFAADRTSPDPDDWVLEAPASGGREGVVLAFPEPFDHGLLTRVLHVRDAGGRRLPGRVEIGEGERRWTFSPDLPWAAGNYEIVVETLLEDLAGNNLRYVFDTDLNQPGGPEIEEEAIVVLPFTVSGGA
jgi:hypothetical protein